MATMATNPYIEGRFNNPQRAFYRSNTSGQINLRRITGVKTGPIYNPSLPSLRRIEMDHLLGKLPDEHCRSTTKLQRYHFEEPTVKIFEDRQFNKQVYRRGHSALPGVMMAKKDAGMQPSRAQIARAEMEALASSSPNLSKYLTTNLNANPPGDLQTAPTRYSQTFKNEPGIDWRGQMPVAARILDRHRAFPNHHRDIASAKWK